MKKLIKLCVLNRLIRKGLERESLLARVAQVSAVVILVNCISAFPFFGLVTRTALKLNKHVGKCSPGKVLARSNEISMPYLKKVD